ncbi:hypothetical protein AQUCO_03500207v1 [Aquilegia coerulea]|uniref:SHSP domain-containing protein n=1 Tax=Aquilegia coerulea TaxID=218851 RepID=A0A2G5CWP8_AQUCA|nr:hypothetical protein AQUCO_03500207v1 [Aquilegia coerulea]
MKYIDQLLEKLGGEKNEIYVGMIDMIRQYREKMDHLIQLQRGDYNKSGNYIKDDADDAVHIRLDMIGLNKEDVKVSVEKNMLIVKVEERKEAGDDKKRMNNSREYVKLYLETGFFKMDEIKAEMKNNVLRVVIPKLKEEERKEEEEKDFIQVKVD